MMFDNERDPYQMSNQVDTVDDRELGEWAVRLRKACRGADDPHLPEAQLLEHLGLAKAWTDRNRPGANG